VSVSPPAPVRVVDRYAIHGRLAQGGMATLHLGRLRGPKGFVRTVVIKQLHPHYAADPEFAAMFLDEARLAARIRHPNVVSTVDVVAEGGELLLVLEYVAGEALVRLLRKVAETKTRVPLAIATTVMTGVLHGLHAAHEAKGDDGVPLGIVHRDVSPQNILVGTDGVARVLDFGLMTAERAQRHPTRPQHFRGKVAYLAPEQLRGEPVTPLSDVYSAGIVLWEIVAGRRLFPSDFGDASEKILAGVREPPSVHTRVGARTLTTLEMQELQRMDAIVMRAVHRDPAERYPTARAMALALEESFPLAAQSAVGLWVESLAKKVLDERASWVESIEGQSLSGTFAATLPMPTVPTREAAAFASTLQEPDEKTREHPAARTLPTPPPVSDAEEGAPTIPSRSRKGLLRVGDPAPDIDAMATIGGRFVLSRSPRPVTVLYFFPMAFTPGCTRETHLFRESYAELALAGAEVVGVSTDDHGKQCAFAESTRAPFPMISDKGGAISRAYGVLWPVLGRAKRVTFVVDRSLTILATFRHEVRIKKHRDDVLAFVDGLFRARRPGG